MEARGEPPARRWHGPGNSNAQVDSCTTCAGTYVFVGTTLDTRRAWKNAVEEAARSRAVLSLAEVREVGRPAFFFDFGEALLFNDGELFDLRHWGVALQFDVDPVPLPRQILEHGVGIEYGWRHAGECDCRACSRGTAARREDVAA
jgi:hypothetical protein